MHDDLNSFKQNPSQKFHKYFINFENPKNFQKPQKLGQNAWNVWLKDRKKIIPE